MQMFDQLKKGGMLISFEGIDGSGKSTQASLTVDYLRQKGYDVVITREPGGTKAGNAIRSILMDGQITLTIESELVLHFVARKEHIEYFIKPALASGKIVICDRFLDSSYAYQGYGSGLSLNFITEIRRLMIGDFAPHKTFLLDVDTKTALKRIALRNDMGDRYQDQNDEYMTRVAQGFRTIAALEPERLAIIDGSSSHDLVMQQIIFMIGN